MKRLPLLLLLLLALMSCSKQKDKGIPLAQVNDEILTLEGFRASMGEERWNAMSPEQKKKYIEDWVNVTLLAQEAEKLGLDKERAIRQRLNFAAKKVKANALIARRLASVRISEDQLFNYYRIHQADFQSKLMEYNVQRILVDKQNSAEILLKRIIDGYAFDEAVLAHSRENLRENLGRMGFIVSGGPDSLFWKAAQKLEQNDPGLLAADEGVYILRWTEQREGTQEANFEEYRNEIRAILLREKQRQVYEDLVKELKTKTGKVYYY